ncbi:MAG TPA: DUF6599 family protein [Thermoanaerobaculia bacterium]|nr:DUF6599 family protein [Thermoanaerobaculia bacterium]
MRLEARRREKQSPARLLALSPLLAFLLLACGEDKRQARPVVRPVPSEESFATIDSPSLQFLPRHREAPGWQMTEDPIVIPAKRLTSHLGTDADHFRRYDAIDLTSGKYVADDGKGFAIVEIFRFPDFVKAFGAYSMRKKGPIRFLDIANEAFEARHSVHLWRGPFYVRALGGGSAAANEALQGLVTTVAARMPAAPSKPAVFNFFPAENRVANSERFSADDGFGQRDLAGSFQATFATGGAAVEGLILPAASKAAATKILDAYRALYVRNGKLLDPVPNLGEDNFTAEDKFLGRTVAFRIDRFVIAFNGYTDRPTLVDLAAATGQRILASIRSTLVQPGSRTLPPGT